MLNLLSILFGLVSLVVVIPATIPLLGWANWFALPLIVSVSLVYAATRHEDMEPILIHAVRTAGWIIGFMLIVLLVLYVISWNT